MMVKAQHVCLGTRTLLHKQESTTEWTFDTDAKRVFTETALTETLQSQ